MRRGRAFAVALCVAAAVAITGATAATAAPPSWHYCAKAKPKNTGGFTDKDCSLKSELGKGKYELLEGIGKGKHFKGKGGELAWHYTIPGLGTGSIACASWSASGAVAVPNLVSNVRLVIRHCKVVGSPCDTEGDALKETIVSEKLSGRLGWLSKPGAAGVSLTSESSPGTGVIANFNCGGPYVGLARWTGTVIAGIAPVGVISKQTEWTYSTGEYLGEPQPGYRPLTNPPGFEEEPLGVLGTEFNGPGTGNEWAPEGGVGSGFDGSLLNKGEALLIA
jgi:hypothetical protein